MPQRQILNFLGQYQTNRLILYFTLRSFIRKHPKSFTSNLDTFFLSGVECLGWTCHNASMPGICWLKSRRWMRCLAGSKHYSIFNLVSEETIGIFLSWWLLWSDDFPFVSQNTPSSGYTPIAWPNWMNWVDLSHDEYFRMFFRLQKWLLILEWFTSINFCTMWSWILLCFGWERCEICTNWTH